MHVYVRVVALVTGGVSLRMAPLCGVECRLPPWYAPTCLGVAGTSSLKTQCLDNLPYRGTSLHAGGDALRLHRLTFGERDRDIDRDSVSDFARVIALVTRGASLRVAPF